MTFGFYEDFEFKQIARKFIKKHRDKDWDWRGLSENSFNGEKEKFTKNKFK